MEAEQQLLATPATSGGRVDSITGSMTDRVTDSTTDTKTTSLSMAPTTSLAEALGYKGSHRTRRWSHPERNIETLKGAGLAINSEEQGRPISTITRTTDGGD